MKGNQNTRAQSTAESGLGSEGAFEDQGKGFGDVSSIHHQNRNATAGVGDGHERNDLLAEIGNCRNAAENGDSGKNDDDDADDPRFDIDTGRSDDARHGACLNGATDAKSRQCGEDGEGSRTQLRPPGCGAVLANEGTTPSVHCAANHLSVGIFHAILKRNVHLGIFGCHTENTGKPHPKNGAWATHKKRGGNANNGSGTDGGRKSGGKSAEAGNIAFARTVAKRNLDGQGKLALDETGTDGEIDMGAQ